MENERLRYAITDVNGLTMVYVCEFLYLLAAGNYTVFIMTDGIHHIQSKSIGWHLARLGGCFLRTSRSEAVNLNLTNRLDNNGILTLTDGTTLDVPHKYFYKVRRAMAAY